MSAAKALELGLRQTLLRVLSALGRRRRPLPAHFDYNKARVLFIRQDRIGDVLVSTPLFGVLRRHYPAMQLDIIVGSNNVAAVEHNIIFTNRWLYTKRSVNTLQMIRRIRRERYDFAVDLMDNPSATSTVIILLSGATWTVGLDKANAFAYDAVVPLRSRAETHIVDRLGEILRVFAIDPEAEVLRVSYEPRREAREAAARFWDTAGLVGRVVIGVNISAGSEARFWGVDRYREFIQRLSSERREFAVLLLARPEDHSRADRIAAGQPNVIRAPGGDFDLFAALIARLSCLLTPDTAAVHLCAAFNVPSVVMYVQSDKSLRIWDPYRTPSESVVSDGRDLSPVRIADVLAAYERLERSVPMQPRGSGS